MKRKLKNDQQLKIIYFNRVNYFCLFFSSYKDEVLQVK